MHPRSLFDVYVSSIDPYRVLRAGFNFREDLHDDVIMSLASLEQRGAEVFYVKQIVRLHGINFEQQGLTDIHHSIIALIDMGDGAPLGVVDVGLPLSLNVLMHMVFELILLQSDLTAKGTSNTAAHQPECRVGVSPNRI